MLKTYSALQIAFELSIVAGLAMLFFMLPPSEVVIVILIVALAIGESVLVYVGRRYRCPNCNNRYLLGCGSGSGACPDMDPIYYTKYVVPISMLKNGFAECYKCKAKIGANGKVVVPTD